MFRFGIRRETPFQRSSMIDLLVFFSELDPSKLHGHLAILAWTYAQHDQHVDCTSCCPCRDSEVCNERVQDYTIGQ